MFSKNILLLLCVAVIIEKISTASKGNMSEIVPERSSFNEGMTSPQSDRLNFYDANFSLEMEKGECSQNDFFKDDAERTTLNPLKPIEEEDLRYAFNMIDKNNDGGISCEELKILFQSLGEEDPDEDIKSMINEYKTKDGEKVTYEDFKELMTTSRDAEIDRKTFGLIDLDNNGFVTPDQLYSFFSKNFGNDFTLEEAETIVTQFGDKDVMQLSFEGFQRFLIDNSP